MTNADEILKNLPISLGFEDISITQFKNKCKSRLDTNIKSEVFRNIYLDIPLIASNMSSVTNSSFCNLLYRNGAMGILHRALKDHDLIREVKHIANKSKLVGVSIGVGEDQFDLCRKLVDAGANIIVIDIAHGYTDELITLGKKIKETFPVTLVVGNVINPDFMTEVNDFADAVKVGIGQGLACETKNTAACTEKQFSAVFRFKELSKKYGLPIISDGGIREPADFVKAIAAGASSVMMGSVFARCPESAALIVSVDGIRKKVYAGMASRRVQEEWKMGIKKGTCPEGKEVLLDIGEPVELLLDRYSGALRSGITYSGATDIQSFQDNVQFVRLAH